MSVYAYGLNMFLLANGGSDDSNIDTGTQLKKENANDFAHL